MASPTRSILSALECEAFASLGRALQRTAAKLGAPAVPAQRSICATLNA
jgi:hypothetical protein